MSPSIILLSNCCSVVCGSGSVVDVVVVVVVVVAFVVVVVDVVVVYAYSRGAINADCFLMHGCGISAVPIWTSFLDRCSIPV